MMQNGLHIGLAAWIHVQRSSNSFPVYPSMPILTTLVDPEAVQDRQDVAQAAEFAQLVNFIPRQGQIADTFSGTGVLWQVHRKILTQMDFSTQPWTRTEQTEFLAARAILYATDEDGLLTPSRKYLFYEEMRTAYRDLLSSGGDGSEIAQAMTDWMVLGHKMEIEDAFELINRMGNRTSSTQAFNEVLLLNEDPPGVGLRFYGDIQFAPVYFAPLSAISRETWMEAKVSFADLDRAVGNSLSNERWKAYLANRTGEVLFNYVALKCIRPWFTPALYQADDWRLNAADDSVVSQGNAIDGLLPAYVDHVYLVSVKNVTSEPKPPPPEPPSLAPWQTLMPQLNRTALQAKPKLQKPLDTKTDGVKNGIKKKEAGTPITQHTSLISSISLSSKQIIGRVLTLPATHHRFTELKIGQIRRLSIVDLTLRLNVMRACLEGLSWTPSAPNEETNKAFVVGFGCEKVPFSPNPNTNYIWQ